MVHLALNSRESLHSSWSVFIYDIGLTIYIPTEVLLVVVLQFVQHLFSGWESNVFMFVNINFLSFVSHLNTITLTNVWFFNHTKSFAFTDYLSERAELYVQHNRVSLAIDIISVLTCKHKPDPQWGREYKIACHYGNAILIYLCIFWYTRCHKSSNNEQGYWNNHQPSWES